MTTPLPPDLDPLRPSDPPEVEDALWEGFAGDLAFDVGARRGENITHLARLGFRAVVACEPHRESYAALMGRYGALSHGEYLKVRLRDVAVTAQPGKVDLAAVPQCMAKGELVTWGLRGMEWEPADWDAVPVFTVPAVTLDGLAAEEGLPDLVVIDTEGHEKLVLEGGPGLIGAGGTDFLIEFHAPGLHEDCRGILETAGYRTVTIRHPHYPYQSAMYFQHGWLKGFAPGRNHA